MRVVLDPARLIDPTVVVAEPLTRVCVSLPLVACPWQSNTISIVLVLAMVIEAQAIGLLVDVDRAVADPESNGSPSVGSTPRQEVIWAMQREPAECVTVGADSEPVVRFHQMLMWS